MIGVTYICRSLASPWQWQLIPLFAMGVGVGMLVMYFLHHGWRREQ